MRATLVVLWILGSACGNGSGGETQKAKERVWKWYAQQYPRCAEAFRAAPIEIWHKKAPTAWDYNALEDHPDAFSYGLEVTIKHAGKLCGDQKPPECETGEWTVGGRIHGTFLYKDDGGAPLKISEKLVSALPALPIEDTPPAMGIFLGQACEQH